MLADKGIFSSCGVIYLQNIVFLVIYIDGLSLFIHYLELNVV